MQYLILIIPTIIIYLFSLKKSKYGLKIAFFLIFIFSALRYDYGNDYMAYYDMFYNIKNLNWNNLNNNYKDIELGYKLLNKFLANIGFNGMLAITSLLNIYTYWKLIIENIKIKIIWFPYILYILNINIFFIQLSAIRQSIAISIIILSVLAYRKKRFIKSVGYILIASFFHKTALFFILVLLFLSIKKNINKIMKMLSLMSLLLLINKNIFFLFLRKIILYFPKYDYYIKNLKKTDINSGIGILINILVLFYLSNINLKKFYKIKEFIKIMYLEYLIMVIAIIFPMLNRLGLYMSFASLIVIPNLVEEIKNRKIKRILIFLIIIYFFRIFYFFFINPLWSEKFGRYLII